jgi:hypothetical protein
MKRRSRLIAISYAALWWAASAQTPDPPAGQSSAPAGSIALSPAVIMVRCKPGQSSTQTLSIANHTDAEVSFKLATEDVVVREGKRVFLAAGKIDNSIAANSIATPATVVVKPGEESKVQVTFTVPAETAQRAVVTFFKSIVVNPTTGSIGLGASMGTLITFNLSGDYQVDAGVMEASFQTPTANMIFSEELRNRGSEPVMPKGVIVVLNTAGKRVAKASFKAQRLLPGEHLTFAATNPAQLPPGHYRTLSSFEFEQKILTSTGEFTIPE